MSITPKKITYFLVVAMMAFSSLVVIQFSGRTLFLFLQIILVFWMVAYRKKVYLCSAALPNLIIISLIGALASAFISDIPFSYKKAAAFMTAYEIPLYLSFCFVNNESERNDKVMKCFLKGFKITVLAQLIWVPMQYLAYHVANIDLNDLFFHRLFHFMENASFIRNWVYYPSGFTWHSAVIAPLFVFAFVMYKNPAIRLLIIADAAICGSSTALVGVICCACILVSFSLFDYVRTKQFLDSKKLVLTAAVILIALGAAYAMGLLDSLADSIMYTVSRLTEGSSDASTNTHLGYYSDYFKIIKNSSWTQIIFGYGYGCSGYPISEMYGLYADHANWAVECDVVNILISRGLFGFTMYYSFLAYILIAGFRVDRKYAAIMIPIIIEGFGYNIQWEYVYMLELVFFSLIRSKISVFEYEGREYQWQRLLPPQLSKLVGKIQSQQVR
ncbi:MAG: hypothetical protein J6X85_09595 [Ruminococcus sp.]|nr:hypothetical protein [Ruminococcus sp.]